LVMMCCSSDAEMAPLPSLSNTLKAFLRGRNRRGRGRAGLRLRARPEAGKGHQDNVRYL
jgi:hypothetical protein